MTGDKVLNQLRIRLRAGAVVPFVGAGVSRAVVRTCDNKPAFPSWWELLDEMARDLEGAGELKYSALMRAHLLPPADYLLAAQVATQRIPKERWTALLERNLGIQRQDVQSATLALARAVWSLGRFVVTTNYDNVLSWAGEDTHRTEPHVVNIQDSKETLIAAINRTIRRPTVWHIHGHVSNPTGIVLAPESYDSVYEASRKGQSQFEAARSVLRMILATRSLLFIGFSLDDLYFAEQIRAISQVFDGKGGPHFALLRRADIERKRDQLEVLGVLPVPYEEHGEPLVAAVLDLASSLQPSTHASDIQEDSGTGGVALDEKAIADAARYLRPDLSIATHDAIADEMRAHAANMIYDAESIKNSAVDPDPARRVAAYVALQMRPYPRLSEIFAAALHREIAEAAARRETRPLWQLLVAIEFAVQSQMIDAANLVTLEASISSSTVVLDELSQPSGVDPGGECRQRLRDLAEALAQAASAGMSLPAVQRVISEFAARNALRVGAPSGPVTSVSGAQAYVAEENDAMGLVYCFITGSRKGTVAWARKGIGLFCRNYPDVCEKLGFPLGREETMVGGAFSRFERGFVEWSALGSRIRAFLGPYPDRSHPLGSSVRI